MFHHRHLFWKGLFSLLLALIWVVASTLPAFADVAPPPRTQSSGIIPDGEQTQVRMMYENVFMDIALDGTAKVDANFVMRNLGDKEEVMDVYFPLYIPDSPYEGYSRCQRDLSGGPIADLAVWVWDRPAPVRTDFVAKPDPWGLTTPSPGNPAKIPCWGVFAVRFPPGLDVPIEVKYTSPNNKPKYTYVLTTGAGWNGTIGQADITFRLPYDAILDQSLDYCTPQCTTKGRDIQWQFMDFEPTQNIQIAIVWTDVWWRVLTESNALKLNPNDGAAWKRLALAYDASAATYHYWWYNKWNPWPLRNDAWRNQKALETLQKAIVLNPGDLSLQDAFAIRVCYNIGGPNDVGYQADWDECLQQIQKTIALAPASYNLRYDFVGLVCIQAWTNSYGDKQSPAAVAAWVECSRQIKQLLELDPKNWKAKLEDVYTIMPAPLWREDFIKIEGDQLLYLLLTPTATPFPTSTVTITPNITTTPTPTLTLTPSPSVPPSQTPSLTATPPANTPTPIPPAAETGSGVTWLWILVPLAALVTFGIVRRRGS
jgi:hypothetical protein